MGRCRSGRKRRSCAKARCKSATRMTTGKGSRTSGRKTNSWTAYSPNGMKKTSFGTGR
jgi:hypothetical protein